MVPLKINKAILEGFNEEISKDDSKRKSKKIIKNSTQNYNQEPIIEGYASSKENVETPNPMISDRIIPSGKIILFL